MEGKAQTYFQVCVNGSRLLLVVVVVEVGRDGKRGVGKKLWAEKKKKTLRRSVTVRSHYTRVVVSHPLLLSLFHEQSFRKKGTRK